MNGARSPNVIIQGSKKYTPRMNPAKAPALLAGLSQLRMLLQSYKFESRTIPNDHLQSFQNSIHTATLWWQVQGQNLRLLP